MMKTKKNESSITALHQNQKLGKDLDFSTTEAYNLLKTNIEFSLKNEEGKGNVIGITSPCPQEGKSYTSINYSYSLAVDGKNVLLIDSDMRRPSIGKSLKHRSKPGLSEVLVGQASAEDIIVKGMLNDNLSVLFAGSIPPNPSKLIRSEAMINLLNDLRTKYDYIVIDLPPVNSVSDAIGISTELDGVIVVIKHAYTRRKDLIEAIRQLKFVKANILGVVYNGYSRSGSYYYHKNKYYKKNYYYYESNYYTENKAEAEESDEAESNKEQK